MEVKCADLVSDTTFHGKCSGYQPDAPRIKSWMVQIYTLCLLFQHSKRRGRHHGGLYCLSSDAFVSNVRATSSMLSDVGLSQHTHCVCYSETGIEEAQEANIRVEHASLLAMQVLWQRMRIFSKTHRGVGLTEYLSCLLFRHSNQRGTRRHFQDIELYKHTSYPTLPTWSMLVH